ncbi:hypothetical protein [Paenibacillus xylanexedens]|uniref:hypothetical protein n=1 Tax=Paenibacillus xylanexedens TaxID=528191 RepID=UPI000F53303F|nr:hypothetical protein [Paenibacillus xylanexedens]RPK31860.1 hypothetical protein EDO6_02487 [Paenibacillus xylanexedens]
MLIKDKLIEVKITNYNKKHYQSLGYKCENESEIYVSQEQIPPSSRIKVECRCDYCLENFERKRVDVKTTTLCSTRCRNEYLKLNNPNPSKDKIEVACAVCRSTFLVNEAKYKNQTHFLCSRKCYSTHRSMLYHSDNVYNYQSIYRKCSNCDKEVKIIEYDLTNRNNSFCSPSCYHVHKKNNFSTYYFNDRLNNSRKETKPEKAVREYLSKSNIKFEQEFCIHNTYFADFYLPDYNEIIEVYGDYWHCNPSKYPEDAMRTEMQIRSINRDKKRNGHLKHLGYSVNIIWEEQVNKNIDHFMGEIVNNIVNKQESATTTRQSP